MSVALSVLVSLSMAACAPRNTGRTDDINRNTRNNAMVGQYRDGIYTGYSDGTGTNRQMATVTIRNGRIVDVDLTTAGNQTTNNQTTNNLTRTGTNTSRLGTGAYTPGRTNYGPSGMQTGRDVRNNTTGITGTGAGTDMGRHGTTGVTGTNRTDLGMTGNVGSNRIGTGNNANAIFENSINTTTPTQFAPNYGKGNNSIVTAPGVPGGGYGPNYTPSYGANYSPVRGGFAGTNTGIGTGNAGFGTTRTGFGNGSTAGTGIGATGTGTNNNFGTGANRFGTNGMTNNIATDGNRTTITPRTVNSVTAGRTRHRNNTITGTADNTGRAGTNIDNGFMNTGIGTGTGAGFGAGLGAGTRTGVGTGAGTGVGTGTGNATGIGVGTGMGTGNGMVTGNRVGGGAEAGFGTRAGTGTGTTGFGLTGGNTGTGYGTTGAGYGTTGTNMFGAIDNNQYDSITRVRSWLTGAILQNQTSDVDLTTLRADDDNRVSMDAVSGWQLAVRRALEQARR